MHHVKAMGSLCHWYARVTGFKREINRLMWFMGKQLCKTIGLVLSSVSSPQYIYVSCFHPQFVFEGMEESGSEGLDDLIFSLKDTFLKVSCFCNWKLTPVAQDIFSCYKVTPKHCILQSGVLMSVLYCQNNKKIPLISQWFLSRMLSRNSTY